MAEAIGLTAEMYRAVVTIVDERVRDIRVTRKDFNELKGAVQELAQAQARTEQRMGGLERAMLELAQAQARTEQQIEKLVQAQQDLARQVGSLSDNIGYELEDIAKVVLPGYLQRHFGLALEGVLGEELNHHFFHN